MFYNITFREAGLPTGSNWSVKLSGVSNYSKTDAVGFSEPNGTGYSFQVTAAGYSPTPSVGFVNVTGSP